MTRHELITRDAAHDQVHQGPLRRREFPIFLRDCVRHANRFAQANVAVEFVVRDEHATPDNRAGLAQSLDCTSAERKIHRGLAFAGRAGVAADQVRGRHRARDFEHPDELIANLATPAHIVERRFRRKSENVPDAIGDERVETSTFVHFIEMWNRLPRVQFFAGDFVTNRRALDVVEQTFDQIGRGRDVLQTLLILNADGIASKFIRDANGGDVHFALGQHLSFSQFVFFIHAEIEFHSSCKQPIVNRARVLIGHDSHFGEQRGLAQAFFEHADRVEQFIRDDGIEHAHTAFVENSHDGFVRAEFARKFDADLCRARRDFRIGKRAHMRRIVRDLARL